MHGCFWRAGSAVIAISPCMLPASPVPRAASSSSLRMSLTRPPRFRARPAASLSPCGSVGDVERILVVLSLICCH
jgi:hypothetical protein